MKLAFLAATMALQACQHIFESAIKTPVREAFNWEKHPKP